MRLAALVARVLREGALKGMAAGAERDCFLGRDLHMQDVCWFQAVSAAVWPGLGMGGGEEGPSMDLKS